MSRRWRRGVARACIAGVLALGACSSGDSPMSSTSSSTLSSASRPTSSSAPAETSSPSSVAAYVPVRPKFPAAARERTDDGTEAFVRYFFELADYAFTKPEGGLLAPLGTENCKTCRRIDKEAKALFANGRRYQSSLLHIKSVTNVKPSADAPWCILNGTQFAVDIVEPDGRLTPASPGQMINFRVELVWSPAGWRVDKVASA